MWFAGGCEDCSEKAYDSHRDKNRHAKEQSIGFTDSEITLFISLPIVRISRILIRPLQWNNIEYNVCYIEHQYQGKECQDWQDDSEMKEDDDDFILNTRVFSWRQLRFTG